LLANHGDASKEMNTKELFLNLGKEFKDKEARINYLESRVQELTDLSEKQKEKIIDAFSHLFSEKELLQELITVYLEYIKTKKQGIPSRQLKKECQRIEDELEEKLGEEAMIKIETILNDCENLLL
jgi:predicted  nucleic acid-binding Zn-ribbon protein